MMTPGQAKIKQWRESPLIFVREVFKVEPDAWQAEILENFGKNKRIALLASKGCGKTCVLSWLAWNYLATRIHPKIAATSISGPNLKDGLWTEMAKWQASSKFLNEAFKWTQTRIFSKESPEQWWMSARTWREGADSSQQANTLAGLHADNMMFILDEVGGIPDAVMAAAEAGLSTGKDSKIIMAGNPTHLSGPLYRAATRERDLWYVKSISGDPDDPQRAQRVSVEWAREQIQKYGKDNPWVLINVFGKFPPSSINSLLGPDEVSEAMRRHIPEDSYMYSQKRLGVDVARFGDDRTIIFPRQGLAAFRPVEMRGAKSNEIAARVIKAKHDWGADMIFVDGTGGWGAGVIDYMLQSRHSPIEISFSQKAVDPRYANKRAEMWFTMAEWIKRGGALPNIPELQKELTTPTYTFTNSGKFILESKEQIKERLGFSPDMADGLCLTFAHPDGAAISKLPGGHVLGGPKHEFEYKPYERKRI